VHKYPQQWYKQNPSEPLKIGLKKAKWVLKRGVLGAKSGYLSLKKVRAADNLERLNGAKCS
jgi:hypothetical protein